MTKSLITTTSFLAIMMMGAPALSQTDAKAGTHVEAEKNKVTQLEGYIIGQPTYTKATNTWRFKFAPKRNKQFEGVYLTVTLPAGKNKKPYYLGDYVKLKAGYDILKTAQTESDARTLATEAAGS